MFGNILFYGLVGFFGLIAIVAFFLTAKYFKLWIQCVFSKAGIGPFSLPLMSLKGVNPTTIVQSKIMAVQAGLQTSTQGLEAHYLAGGNVDRVVRALIASHRASIELDWDTAAAIDLAGRNVLEAVRTSVDPKVIDCPDPNRGASNRRTLDGVAKDGIQLKARARVTVRTNL